MIGIVDYGMGNLFSVSKALERLGANYLISADKKELLNTDALILPGVGSFRDAMDRLPVDTIKEFAETGKPLLGICLGMQLLFETSEENGLTKGLGLLPGSVRRFPGQTKDGGSYKVPHMGWNRLNFVKPSPLLENLKEDYVYFVHSYYVDASNSDVLIAKADYHEQVAAVVGKDHIFGMQFHPEKSSQLGMALLSNFLKMAVEREAVR
ncbi:imidazole glycerol phosphate synthase subunit HisH [Neobacillus thermocopriae]|uniref:imidazole glycerol phosphate synthase subunit HisH n=1 Tax=Neobacillus thermocopriae TaxID=1215031 RepID=UPI002E22AE0D|nr:imidazole glycerol phosphate synthase subunit HisH [Neobacillus thermocopriae]MED3622839.1 imidazole glycerol phosphate synthase subunit HisH [Neobacillus thermocopriae]MED3714703.1 imidazole glycerol phosphate synthase subunit HisH [Neobacillus thermocopriae]